MLAGGFDERTTNFEPTYNINVENTKKYLHANDIVLDFGCATGNVTIEIAAWVKEVHGIDFSSKMIEAAVRKAVEKKMKNIRFFHSTIFDEKLNKETYDVILALNILHLVEDAPAVIRRINELLKPGGIFVSSTACMRDGKTIPVLINKLIFLLGKAGIAPSIRFSKVSELEQSVTNADFQILETENIAIGSSSDNQSSLFDYYIAAKKRK
jgi:2-polyprenyl-3-methyl-5-hydroxy-6-metoxy-1,4-benzoquinol methylase